MKASFLKLMCVVSGVGLCAGGLPAQETSEIELLQKEVREVRKYVQELERKIDKLEAKPAAVPPVAGTPGTPADIPAAANAQTAKVWSPTDPIRIGKGGTYADIGLVATFAAGGSTASDIEGGTQPGGHDPNQRGFTVQGVELNLQGAIDPYLRGNANILFSLDSGGESFVELEEAWLESVSLPGNLQIRAGQILTDFGRINTQHPHAWAFVDSPLVAARLLGTDGLRNPGARLSWLVPTPFYSELSFGIQNSQGETATSFRSDAHSHGGEAEEGLPFGYRHLDNDRGVSGFEDLLFTPRLMASFDLTDSQTLVLGVSGAFGPNSSGAGGDTTTQIYGVDVYWKWKPANAHGGFPFVSFQTEGMLRHYELGVFNWDENGDGLVDEGEVVDPGTALPATLAAETVTDWGFYSQLLYGFRKGWVAGIRLDYLTGETGDYERLGLTLDGDALGRDPLRAERWRVSPNLTWYPSEFSKVRLQYNYDDRRDLGVDHSLWLQFEFLLGAHAAHQF